MKKIILVIIIILLGVAQLSFAQEFRKRSASEKFFQNLLQPKEDDLTIILKTCTKYGLSRKDAYIIDALRHIVITALDEKLGLGTHQFPNLLFSIFGADVSAMIDWACIHFQKIHVEYDAWEPTEKEREKPPYIDFIIRYFYKISKKIYNFSDESIPYLIEFTTKYVKAHYPEVDWGK